MLETTAGTAVAATAIWRGKGLIEDQREVRFPEEDVGYLSLVDRSYTPAYAAVLAMDEIEATFEQLPYILTAGVKAVTSGSADGTGSGYVYTYTFPTTTANTVSTFTIEAGDNQEVEEMEYAFVESFKLSGAMGEAVMMSAEWRGRQATLSSFTGALSVPTVEEILASKTKLYIDAISGTIGTTQKTGTLLSWALNVTTGMQAYTTADGALYFTANKQVGPEVTLELVFEFDGTSTAEKVIWRAGTARLIRLEVQGTALTTAGTFSYKTLRIDLAGKWEKFNKIDEQDGNDFIAATFRSRYDSTSASFAEIKVVNNLSALP